MIRISTCSAVGLAIGWDLDVFLVPVAIFEDNINIMHIIYHYIYICVCVNSVNMYFLYVYVIIYIYTYMHNSYMYISVRACHVRRTTHDCTTQVGFYPRRHPWWVAAAASKRFLAAFDGDIFFGPTRYPTGDSFRQELVMKRTEANDGLLAGP